MNYRWTIGELQNSRVLRCPKDGPRAYVATCRDDEGFGPNVLGYGAIILEPGMPGTDHPLPTIRDACLWAETYMRKNLDTFATFTGTPEAPTQKEMDL